MGVDYTILHDIGVVYVRYTGVAQADATLEAFGRYMSDPGFRPGHKQFVDFSELTGLGSDYVDIMNIQMKKAEAFLQGSLETLVVYYAPTDLALQVAEIAARAWDDSSHVVAIVQQDEADALALLGVKARTTQALLAEAA